MNAICDEIKTLLSAGLGNGYAYLVGENKRPAATDLPLIEIKPINTNYGIAGIGGLRKAFRRVDIILKLLLKDYLKTDTTRTEILHLAALVDIMEETDTDGKPKDATVLGVIDNNLNLNGKAHIIQDININYDEIEYSKSYVSARMELTIKTILPLT